MDDLSEKELASAHHIAYRMILGERYGMIFSSLDQERRVLAAAEEITANIRKTLVPESQTRPAEIRVWCAGCDEYMIGEAACEANMHAVDEARHG